jgi:hypothetical protein
VDRLTVRDAQKHRDGHRLLTFRCWTGDEEFDPWVREVEEYVQMIALKHARHVLVFDGDQGELAGVSAFNIHEVSIGRRRVPAWYFEVIALSLAWQRRTVEADIGGCEPTMKASEYLLRATFRKMLELDKRRTLVEAKVHHDNRASMKVCARVGLDRWGREDRGYWPMLGEVDPAAGPTA